MGDDLADTVYRMVMALPDEARRDVLRRLRAGYVTCREESEAVAAERERCRVAACTLWSDSDGEATALDAADAIARLGSDRERGA